MKKGGGEAYVEFQPVFLNLIRIEFEPFHSNSGTTRPETSVNYKSALRNIREGHAVAQLVEALRYKPEGRGFDSPMVSLEFIYIILPAALRPWG